MTPDFTEGARRALAFATWFAHQRGSALVEPEHLLGGLVVDEARAAEILSTFSVSVAGLDERLPGLGQLASAVEAGTCSAPPMPHSTSTEHVIEDARALARRETESGEVGSEHLLWSLVRIRTDVTSLLSDYGVTQHALDRLLHVPHGGRGGDEWAAPIEPDEAVSALAEEMQEIPRVALGRPARQSNQAVGEEDAEATAGMPGTQAHQAAGLPAATDVSSAAWRVLDAAANRAREGLRVLEDYARFFRNESSLCLELKQMRHTISQQLPWSHSSELLTHRDTPGDVGTRITIETETQRNSVEQVLRANCKRVQESIRTLEEFGKLVDRNGASLLEHIRYRLYAIEQLLLPCAAAAATKSIRESHLYLLLTRDQCRWPVLELLPELIAAGVDVIQLREKQMTDRELLEWGRAVREVLPSTDCLLIMNDRPDLARLVPCDGVHLGQTEIPAHAARRVLPNQMLLGISTHSPAEALQALDDRADYIGVGPVFPSATKAFPKFVGPGLVRQVVGDILHDRDLPAFAIGGIDLENLDRVLATGCDRVAVSHAICGAGDPVAAAAAFAGRLRDA